MGNTAQQGQQGAGMFNSMPQIGGGCESMKKGEGERYCIVCFHATRSDSPLLPYQIRALHPRTVRATLVVFVYSREEVKRLATRI